MMVGGVLCVPVWAHRAPHPPFFLFCFACLFYGVRGLCAGLCGVVDVGDEFVLVLRITAAHVRFLCVAWTL